MPTAAEQSTATPNKGPHAALWHPVLTAGRRAASFAQWLLTRVLELGTEAKGYHVVTKKGQMRPGGWVLLALLAAKDHSLTPVQLQKSLFLLGKRRPHDIGKAFYHFRPYDYGPFDVAVYTDTDQLVEEGLVTVDRRMGRSLRRFELTVSRKG